MFNKVVFKEIIESAWIDTKETDMNKDGQHLYFKLVSINLEPFRSNSLWFEDGGGGWLCVNPL